MKKFLAFILVLLFLLGVIISCNVMNNENGKNSVDGFLRIEVPIIQTADINQ